MIRKLLQSLSGMAAALVAAAMLNACSQPIIPPENDNSSPVADILTANGVEERWAQALRQCPPNRDEPIKPKPELNNLVPCLKTPLWIEFVGDHLTVLQPAHGVNAEIGLAHDNQGSYTLLSVHAAEGNTVFATMSRSYNAKLKQWEPWRTDEAKYETGLKWQVVVLHYDRATKTPFTDNAKLELSLRDVMSNIQP